MGKIKIHILYIILIIILIFFLRLFITPKIINNDIIKETVLYDTIISSDTVILFKPIYKPKYDTIYKTDTINYSVCEYIRVYNDSLCDTNITIYSDISTIGELEYNKISYKLKVPVKIIEIHNITNVETKPPKVNINGFIEVGGNNNKFNTSAGIRIKVKNIQYGYRRGISDKTNNISLGLNLYSK